MAVASRSFSHYLFVDESGDIAQRNTAHMICCVVATTDRYLLDQIVRSTRNLFRDSLPSSGPLHAAQNKPAIIRHLLSQVARQSAVRIVAGILNRDFLLESSSNRNDIYGRLLAHTLNLAVANLRTSTGNTHIAIEQSFTKSTLNAVLGRQISEAVNIAERQIAIVPKTNREWGQGLQIADYVAWSLFQKHERQNGEFTEMLHERLVCEEVVGSRGGQIRPILDFWQ